MRSPPYWAASLPSPSSHRAFVNLLSFRHSQPVCRQATILLATVLFPSSSGHFCPILSSITRSLLTFFASLVTLELVLLALFTSSKMEHFALQCQRRDMKHKGRNVVWSTAMDKCLIEALAIQAKNGNKVDKCFNENAYTAACVAVNTRFNLNLNNQKVVNRLKTIKKRYKVMKDMLNQDGFWWNPNTKMIECDSDELWKRYISAHPAARGFRGKHIEMYDELKIVCGNYQAPGHCAKIKDVSNVMDIKNCDDESASFVSPTSEDMSETDGTQSYTGPPEHDQGPDGFQEPPLVEPLGHLRKQSHSSDALQDALMAVATSIRRLADSVERSKCSIDANELLQAVMEIDGLEEGRQMYAFEYLNADPVKARAFMTYNPRMRETYLFRQFWWWR